MYQEIAYCWYNIVGLQSYQHIILTFNLQVVAVLQDATDPFLFKQVNISSNIPINLPLGKRSPDPVQVAVLNNRTYIFARSQTNESLLYWNSFSGTYSTSLQSNWAIVGDSDKYLSYDPYVAINEFLGRIEVFVVIDSDVYHTWQTSETSFGDKWEKLGTFFTPKFNSSPVVHQMGHSDINGALSLFVRGTDDGTMYHISQMTCIKSKPPWGPCTWGTFSKLGGVIPARNYNKNPLTAYHNIHRGIEVSQVYVCVCVFVCSCLATKVFIC